MKIEEIFDNWKQDVVLDKTKLSIDSINVPKLHHKYLSMLSRERLTLKKYENDLKSLTLLKHEYYKGVLSDEELQQNNWPPFQKKILNQELPLYLDADKQLINLKLKISYIREKIEVLDNILKSLSTRGFLIKNYIDFEKFMNGY